jgi:hypothetical protein
MKKNPTTIFIQLLKTNIVKKNMKKEEKRKVLPSYGCK